MSPRRTSIRTQLISFFVLTSAGALVTASIAFVGYDVFAFKRQMVRDLETMAVGLGINSAGALDFGDTAEAGEVLAPLGAQANITRAVILTPAGTIFAGYRRPDLAGTELSVPTLAAGDHEFAGPGLRVHRAISRDDEVVGSVFIESDMRALRSRLKTYGKIALLVVIGSLLVALILATALQGRISRPILRLADLAGRISRGKDYSLRAAERGADEIGQLVGGLNGMLDEIQKRDEFLRKTFGRYLSDEIVETLLESPDHLAIGGGKRTVTILMSDLRGFTAVSERLEPEQVVQLLNNFLGTMTEVIAKYQGTIDEFIGDAILVIFGAPIVRPDDARRAAACAVEMQSAMKGVNEWNRAHRLPVVDMGIGLNTGAVVVGNIGSQKRSKYAVVGPSVNLTSRVESFTVGGEILVTDDLIAAAGELALGRRTEVTVKGVEGPFAIQQLLGVGAPYDVELPTAVDELVPLPSPIALTFTRLEGKEVSAGQVPGKIVSLGELGAECSAIVRPDPMTNLKIYLVLDEAKAAATTPIYAKVLDWESDDRRIFYLRFTSVPGLVGDAFERRRQAAAKV